jgi:hypothetical protein
MTIVFATVHVTSSAEAQDVAETIVNFGSPWMLKDVKSRLVCDPLG